MLRWFKGKLDAPNRDNLTLFYPPVTYSIGFVRCCPVESAEAYVAWLRRLHLTEMKNKTSLVEGPLGNALSTLKRLRTPYNKVLFTATDSEWTSVFTNDSHGWGCREHTSQLGIQLGRETIHVSCIPHSFSSSNPRGQPGCVCMEINASKEVNGYVCIRHAGVYFESSWEFLEWGSRLPFEKPEYYSRRRIRERFPPELLAEYLEYYRIRVFDPTFYLPHKSSNAVLAF